MYFLPLFAIVVILTGAFLPHAEAEDLNDLTITELEQRLTEIDTELNLLAHTSLRTGVGSIGYRTRSHESAHHTEWIQIELNTEYELDEIILVPNVYRDSQKGFQADGFPAEFRILTGTTNDQTGILLGEFKSENGNTQGIAPRVIIATGVKASWIRIEATRLSHRSFDKHLNKHYILQLAEILIFSGEKNVALHQPVTASSGEPEFDVSPWKARYLVDGHTPYLMDAAQGLQSVAYISQPNQPPILTIDLEAEVPVSRIHLHALEQSDTVPQAYAGNLGIPHHLKIEGAKSADFSDAVTLVETKIENIHDAGPIMMWNVPETSCRYIRISEVNPTTSFRIGFAEIELFANSQNIALGKRVSGPSVSSLHRTFEALTDGHNLYGKILSARSWMKQLARRDDLESERTQVVKELALRYEHQKNSLRLITLIAAILLLGTVALVCFQYIMRQRAITRTRERIAANLHDELGANLHAIGLLGDFAKKIVIRKNATSEWDELNEVIDEVRQLTEETGETARYCTNMLETKEIHANLIVELKRATERMLTDLEYEATFPDDHHLNKLKPRRRIDLYLFYKECLTNILRHSGATRVTAELRATDKHITLIVSDNGRGIHDTNKPASLRRRAKMLGGSVHVKNLETGGAQISLQLQLSRTRLFNKK